MGNLTPNDQWDSTYRLETDDPVLGGAGGISNRPSQNNLNRTERIKNTLSIAGVDVVNGVVATATTSQKAPTFRATAVEVTNRTDIAKFVVPADIPRSATDLEVTNRTDVGDEVYVKPNQIPTSIDNATHWDGAEKIVSTGAPVVGAEPDGSIWFRYVP